MRLWMAQAVSAFGSRITRTALPIIAVVSLGEPESLVAALVALQLAPGVILALFSGGFVDRGNKRQMLIAVDVIRALAIGSLTLAWAVGMLTLAHVIVVGCIGGAASALGDIAGVAFLPSLISKEQLVDGNAKLATTDSIAEITGPASAGVLIAVLGAPLAVALDAATYVWSAVMLARIREAIAPRVEHVHDATVAEPLEVPDAAAVAGGLPLAQVARTGAAEDLRLGMRAVFGHAQVRPIVIALMIWSIVGGFFSSLYPLYLLRELHLSEAAFGVIVSLGGIGALGGALLSRRMAEVLGVGKTLIVCAAISLSSMFFIVLARDTSIVGLSCLGAQQMIGDCFAVAFVIQATSLRQIVLPVHLLGRANAAILACTSGMLPIAALIAGVLAEGLGTYVALWIGLAIGLVAPFMLLSLRTLRVMPT